MELYTKSKKCILFLFFSLMSTFCGPAGISMAQLQSNGQAPLQVVSEEVDIEEEACCVCWERKPNDTNSFRPKCNDTDTTKVCRTDRRYTCIYEQKGDEAVTDRVLCFGTDQKGNPIRRGGAAIQDITKDLKCSSTYHSVIVDSQSPGGSSSLPQQMECALSSCTDWSKGTKSEPAMICFAGDQLNNSGKALQYFCKTVRNAKNAKDSDLINADPKFEFPLENATPSAVCFSRDDVGNLHAISGKRVLKVSISKGSFESMVCDRRGCEAPITDFQVFWSRYCSNQQNTTKPPAATGTSPAVPTGQVGIRVELYTRGFGQGCRPCDDLHKLLQGRADLQGKYMVLPGSPTGLVPHIRVMQGNTVIEAHPGPNQPVDVKKIIQILDKHKNSSP
jgi:hypothetical protein